MTTSIIKDDQSLGKHVTTCGDIGKHGPEIESKKNAEDADQFADPMRSIIDELIAEGFTIVRGIFGEMEQAGCANLQEQWSKMAPHVNVPIVKAA
ncbi:hypothetical protein DYBT9623_05347 [Dyadobacter sp. CECT 9623]|uniref:Uncharacterized protein n=1 Tax=Dyadobacter linearis TaxID=2823330 RepID=A0ABM8UZ53_9BACT|nr:hypothetical protein [Dyadobacter sp. CECT 9623]CAG5074660.1 hypothetical protein DYBT9623_05347 [Dyadobacter sp. CECT 9623]